VSFVSRQCTIFLFGLDPNTLMRQSRGASLEPPSKLGCGAVQAELPEGSQTHFRSIVTDAFLRVKGSDGSIYAIGDAATIEQVPDALR